MSSDPSVATNPSRRPLYVVGAILLALVVIGSWFSDRLGLLFQKTPKATLLEGTWIAVDPKTQKRDSPTVITFAPGTISLDTGNGLASPIPCTIQGYPPNAYLVTIGEGLSLREFVFQLNSSDGAERLCLSVGYWQVPFLRKE